MALSHFLFTFNWAAEPSLQVERFERLMFDLSEMSRTFCDSFGRTTASTHTRLHSHAFCHRAPCNGPSAESQALNYANVPLCNQLRDLDLRALQLGCLLLGAPVVLDTVLERFGLSRWLLDPTHAEPSQR